MSADIPYKLLAAILYGDGASSSQLDKANNDVDSAKPNDRSNDVVPRSERTIAERLLSFILANLYDDIRAQTTSLVNAANESNECMNNIDAADTTTIVLLVDLQLLCEYDPEVCARLLQRFRQTQATIASILSALLQVGECNSLCSHDVERCVCFRRSSSLSIAHNVHGTMQQTLTLSCRVSLTWAPPSPKRYTLLEHVCQAHTRTHTHIQNDHVLQKQR
jgi:hypothetical protein